MPRRLATAKNAFQARTESRLNKAITEIFVSNQPAARFLYKRDASGSGVRRGFGFCRAAPYTARPSRLRVQTARCGNPVGSPATLSSKPRQVRKEATVAVMCVPGSGWQGGLSFQGCSGAALTPLHPVQSATPLPHGKLVVSGLSSVLQIPGAASLRLFTPLFPCLPVLAFAFHFLIRLFLATRRAGSRSMPCAASIPQVLVW